MTSTVHQLLTAFVAAFIGFSSGVKYIKDYILQFDRRSNISLLNFSFLVLPDKMLPTSGRSVCLEPIAMRLLSLDNT